jgi:multidrug efflux pump subunit AcrA (membrane-fusion protein)
MYQTKSFWIVVVVILLVIASGGYYYVTSVYLPAQSPVEAETLETARVRRGDLIVSASSVGKLVPVREAAIGFQRSGIIAELNVQPGDLVRAGQVLARLDDSEVQVQLAQAESNLRLAQHKLEEAGTTAAQVETNLELAELKLTEATNDSDQAAANLQLAELKLDSLLANPDAEVVTVALANLNSIETELEVLLAGPTEDEITVAAVEMEQAAVALKQAQTAYDTVAWADDLGASPQAAALQAASLIFEKSRANYRQKIAGATPDKIAAVEARLAQAQQQYDDLLAGTDTYDIAAAQIAVEQAQAALNSARDTSELVLGVRQAQTALQLAQDTTSLEIGVELAQLAVETAKQNLDALSLRAPFAGTVTEVNTAVGEPAGTAPIVTLFDSSRAQLELFLDETDLDKLSIGNEVEVVFDALPDQTFTGRIVRINPSLAIVDGVPVVSALAELDETENAEPATFVDGLASPLPSVKLLPGMSASIEVIAGRAEDTLLVPVEALRELGPGQYAVFILEEGQPMLRPVEVGLRDFTYAEILDGLTQGDEVTTGIVETE